MGIVILVFVVVCGFLFGFNGFLRRVFEVLECGVGLIVRGWWLGFYDLGLG